MVNTKAYDKKGAAAMHGSLETIGVEVDLCAPGLEEIIDPSPPVEAIARDIVFGEGPTWDAKNGKAKTFDDITPAMFNNVLGTQGALWTEFVEDEERIQWNSFPRLAAKAEVAWSQDEVSNYEDFQKRWRDFELHLNEMGLNNCAPQSVCNPSLFRQVFAKYLDMRHDMQAEQKRWKSRSCPNR